MRLSPLAVGTLAGLAGAAIATPLATDALTRLRSVRLERATLAQIAAAPPPGRAIVVEGRAISAPDAGSAADALAAGLRARATRGGLLVEEAVPVASAGLARVRLRVSGGEAATIAFADAVERGTPAVRFAGWSAQAATGGVTFSAEAVAPWQ